MVILINIRLQSFVHESLLLNRAMPVWALVLADHFCLGLVQ